MTSSRPGDGGAPGATVERARLRDGSEVMIRPIAPDDKALLVDAFERLSEESRYRRFLSPVRELTSEDLSYLTEVDHRRHEALIAIEPSSGSGIGVARFVKLPDAPDAAEVAVTVVDDWQGRGLGTLLMERLSDRARELGVRRYRALVAPSNRRMVDVLDRIGPLRRETGQDGAIEYEVELPPEGIGDRLRRTLRAAGSGRVLFEWTLAHLPGTEPPKRHWLLKALPRQGGRRR
jgi:RimJ/RimL family protein N-acetyltransferase